MAVERVLPAYVRQMGMILPVVSVAGMVPFVKHKGLAERVTGFASGTLDRVSRTLQDSMSFELASSESNSALGTLCLTFGARTSFTKSFFLWISAPKTSFNGLVLMELQLRVHEFPLSVRHELQ